MTGSHIDSPYEVAIIGAGVGGIAVAVNLIQRGISNFALFDKGAGFGGTWWHNRYPGSAVDVTSELYSFSFKPHVFTRSHAGQSELLDYIGEVVEEYDLKNHAYLDTSIESVTWDDSSSLWTLTSDGGQRWQAHIVVSAVGLLSDPRTPDWPGLASFAGDIFHTSKWPANAGVTGKRVAVIGTGSTGAQVIAAIAPDVHQLTLFQREPGWVLPKGDYDYSEEERSHLKGRAYRPKMRRLKAFLSMERFRSAAREGSKRNKLSQRMAERYLEDTIADPALRAALTPDYPFGRKRALLTSDYFSALQRENVTLVPRAVDRITPGGVVDTSGVETEVDLIIMATGFQAERPLSSLDVRGRGGRSLHEEWGTEPRTFLGLMASGFPNFMMLYGPNTNGGTIMFTLERQAEWVARAAKRRIVRGFAAYDVRPHLLRVADRIVANRNSKFAWASGTNNYYTSASGRVVTQWPYTQTAYWFLLRVFSTRRACRET